MITQSELKAIASYDPETGIFIRKVATCNSVKVGEEIGCAHKYTDNLSYRQMERHGKAYLMHRLAYLYMTGSFPDGDIDHIDGDGLNNKWDNLRVVTDSENLRNQKKYKNNVSGVVGVSFYKRDGTWRAAINTEKGKKKHLGYFDTFEEAKAVRLAAEKDHAYHDNHGRIV